MALVPQGLLAERRPGGAPRDRMPARVARLVVDEEARSERLIGWVQLAIVTIFAALYTLAPRPSDGDSGFEPVPVVLGAYAAFTALRLVASYRGVLPGWFLFLSMLADVTLLYGLIWSFHIAYAQPAPFYLKVPTFAYIFVFISVRVLRFDPRFVLGMGLMAAAGWLAMVVYAVSAAGPQTVTRSFVAYLTDNVILVGAEFDKVFVILTVSGVLALALARARATLLIAVREGAATRDMRRYFGAGVAEAITSRERAAMAGDAELRDAAILMLDLRGFTRFAATRTPQDVVAALTDYHALVVPLIEREGGVVDKFLGDGVMASFGAVVPSPAPAAEALRALEAVLAAAPEWAARRTARGDPALPVNGAAVAGRVLAATVGNDRRLEFTVIGAAANLAARLEKHNKAAGTAGLTTSATLALARAQGYSGPGAPLAPTRVADIDEPLLLCKLA